jgi:chaperonin GroES
MLQRLSKKIVINEQVTSSPNLCDRFTTADLASLGRWVYEGYQRDKQSRAKWEIRMEASMDLAMQIQKDKSFPWPGCSNVVFPLVTIAALQFSSRSYGNIISGQDIVKYRVVGTDPDQKIRERADRISKHMSWQVLEEDTAWEEQHDRLLINLGIVGCNFVKTYFDSGLRHNVSELVMARDFVLDYWAKSVESCARKTQVIPMYRNQIYENVVNRIFEKVLDSEWFNSGPPSPPTDSKAQQDNRQGMLPPAPDADTPFRTYEQHRLLDLDQDGYAEPYIVTIEESTQKVLRLVSRWEREEDIDKTDFPGTTSKIRRIKPTEYYTKFGFIPAPDGGIYDIGFGTLLGPLNESVSSGINQLLDAGTMSNSNGGFLGRGVKIRGGVYTMAPWTWKRVDSTGDDLRKAMVPFPTREPSDVMFKLLGLLINYTDRLAGTTDVMVGENPGQNTPAETSRNMMEQGTKVYSGIYKRVWRSMKEEFKKLHRLNVVFLEPSRRFGNSDQKILQEDYKTNPDLVVPAADPNIVSDGMRLTQASAVRQAAHTVPGYSIEESEKNYLRALKIDAIDLFYPGPEKVPPLPNPKASIEQMKLQGLKMKLDYDKWEFTTNLMAQRQEMQAKVLKLYAEVQNLMAQTQSEKVNAKVSALNLMIDAFKAHSDAITNHLAAISGGQNGDQGDGGNVGGVEAKPGNASSPAVPSNGAAGAPAAVGGG